MRGMLPYTMGRVRYNILNAQALWSTRRAPQDNIAALGACQAETRSNMKVCHHSYDVAEAYGHAAQHQNTGDGTRQAMRDDCVLIRLVACWYAFVAR